MDLGLGIITMGNCSKVYVVSVIYFLGYSYLVFEATGLEFLGDTEGRSWRVKDVNLIQHLLYDFNKNRYVMMVMVMVIWRKFQASTLISILS